MSGRRYRVAVQFTEYCSDDEPEKLTVKNLPMFAPMRPAGSQSVLHSPSSKHIEVEVLSMNALQMVNRDNPAHSKVTTMRFDCVGSSTDTHVRSEVGSLVDHMFVQEKNCFLLHFSASPECQMQFLCNLLVTEVDKCVQLLHCKIGSITLEYYELRKHGVVNILAQTDPKASKVKKADKSKPPTLNFQSTLELLKWLQGKYVQLWRNCVGNECLDFVFQFHDMHRQVHTVKLSLMLLYMHRMDSETKTKLSLFLKNLGGDRKIKRTMLGDFLKEYFHGDEKWRTLIFFDVPVIYGCGFIIEDMLEIASKAYDGVTSMKNNLEDDVSININQDVLSDTSAEWTADNSSHCSTSNAPPTQLEHPVRVNQPPRLQSGGFAGLLRLRDHSSLRQWHRRIDESYANVVAHLEAFYCRKYQHKIGAMCTDIRSMAGSFDLTSVINMGKEQASQEPVVAHILNSTPHTDDINTYYNQYKKAIADFRHISSEIERTKYVSELRAYFKAKNTELAQHALIFKIQQLESCQKEINSVIKTEMNSLQSKNVNKQTIAS